MADRNIFSLLKKASEAYYSGMPFMSDSEFDALSDKYGYSYIGASPTTKTQKHLLQLYSLQKVYEGEDKYPFPESDGIKTPKLDGAAISLLYKDGRLVSALIRGDGIEGGDIIDKAYMMPSIPKTISFSYLCQVTGEVVAPKTINNARNYAAGALNLKDLTEFKTRKVEFVAYGLQTNLINVYDTYLLSMQLLETLGFRTVLDNSLTDIYPTDGIVIRVNSNKKFKELGYTSTYPRGAYAIKKRSDVDIKETKLLDVVWQMGKGRKCTPVAIFEEVVIDGAKINRATLHNAGFIEDLDLSLGDTLLVTRSGGIIPKVLGKV